MAGLAPLAALPVLVTVLDNSGTLRPEMSAPTIYCCGRQTFAVSNSTGWFCYWCRKRVRVVWPLA